MYGFFRLIGKVSPSSPFFDMYQATFLEAEFILRKQRIESSPECQCSPYEMPSSPHQQTDRTRRLLRRWDQSWCRHTDPTSCSALRNCTLEACLLYPVQPKMTQNSTGLCLVFCCDCGHTCQQAVTNSLHLVETVLFHNLIEHAKQINQP